VSELHPATRGFAADVYERGRPEYAAAAIERLVEVLDLRAGRTVLDLAAGTGKLARLLLPSGAKVIAVEPLPEMRAELERRVPGVTALAGTAESIPVAHGSVDAVTVGSAFHWFHAERALSEIHRTLTPGSGLALLWNARNEGNEVHRALSEILEPLRGETPDRTRRDWGILLIDSGLFERVDRRLFPHEQLVDEDGLVARVLSVTFVGLLSDAERHDVGQEVRAIARATEQPIRLTYTTELFVGFNGVGNDLATCLQAGCSRSFTPQFTDGSSGMRETSS
jgi:SAM-dependent methyltransferase